MKSIPAIRLIHDRGEFVHAHQNIMDAELHIRRKLRGLAIALEKMIQGLV